MLSTGFLIGIQVQRTDLPLFDSLRWKRPVFSQQVEDRAQEPSLWKPPPGENTGPNPLLSHVRPGGKDGSSAELQARQSGVEALFLSTCDGASGPFFMYYSPDQHNRTLFIILPSDAHKEDMKTLPSFISPPFLESQITCTREGPGIQIWDLRMETPYTRPNFLPTAGIHAGTRAQLRMVTSCL